MYTTLYWGWEFTTNLIYTHVDWVLEVTSKTVLFHETNHVYCNKDKISIV